MEESPINPAPFIPYLIALPVALLLGIIWGIRSELIEDPAKHKGWGLWRVLERLLYTGLSLIVGCAAMYLSAIPFMVFMLAKEIGKGGHDKLEILGDVIMPLVWGAAGFFLLALSTYFLGTILAAPFRRKPK